LEALFATLGITPEGAKLIELVSETGADELRGLSPIELDCSTLTAADIHVGGEI
jgi:hypothetical protein